MIELSKIRLINWYGFSSNSAPIGLFTLIAGKNGNGKSVMLDAIKYALFGDTIFNKSTENKGSRTIVSYTRGLLDATEGSYMRPADKEPNVFTHIVLEMYERDLDRYFVLGTVIETNSTTITTAPTADNDLLKQTAADLTGLAIVSVDFEMRCIAVFLTFAFEVFFGSYMICFDRPRYDRWYLHG